MYFLTTWVVTRLSISGAFAATARVVPSLKTTISHRETNIGVGEWFPGHFDTVGDALMNPFLSVLKRALQVSCELYLLLAVSLLLMHDA